MKLTRHPKGIAILPKATASPLSLSPNQFEDTFEIVLMRKGCPPAAMADPPKTKANPVVPIPSKNESIDLTQHPAKVRADPTSI